MRVEARQIKKDFIRKGNGTNIFTAVAPCDFTLEEGTLTVLRGRSGSGKSTFLNMLLGILRPSEGKVFYGDRDIYAMSDEALSRFRNDAIGFVPQGKSAIASMTVEENVLMPALLYGKNRKREAGELMERFGILSIRDAMPEELSGGELRRMAIARACLNAPQVMFADEPTGDLDDENTRVVFEALRELAKGGTAVLMVTHEEDAKAYADRRYKMDAGVLYEE